MQKLFVAIALLLAPTLAGCGYVNSAVAKVTCATCKGKGTCTSCDGTGKGFLGYPCGWYEAKGRCTDCKGMGFTLSQ